MLSTATDVTELREFHMRHHQLEKLKSLGELASGVAHDFNNCLAAILGRAQLMQIDSIPEPKHQKSWWDEIKSQLKVIEIASKDGAETVRRIQEFSRINKADDKRVVLDLNEIIQNSIDLTKSKWETEATLHSTQYSIGKNFGAIPLIEGNASQLREVFVNLINNAIDAMPKGGSLQLKTSAFNGKSIMIEVKDSGTGMPEEMIEKIFDPFFTTKGVKATGLGMSVSFGIIDAHDGLIKCKNNSNGIGTTFTITLPIKDKTSTRR